MSFKDAILFDMNFIIKEIDTIDDEELEKIYKLSQRFVRDLGRELTERCGYEDGFQEFKTIILNGDKTMTVELRLEKSLKKGIEHFSKEKERIIADFEKDKEENNEIEIMRAKDRLDLVNLIIEDKKAMLNLLK